jgi:acyl transferase domain-containing protein
MYNNKLTGRLPNGCARSMFANLISFAFDFRGPSMAVDTACSSSLTALELAWRFVLSGECDGAIVAGGLQKNYYENIKTEIITKYINKLSKTK